jgi:protein gp37
VTDAPLPNVWLGVSCEDQERANERIPILLQMPAAKRFISYEPALGPINLMSLRLPSDGSVWTPDDGWRDVAFGHALAPNIDWVIAGGESGPGARPVHPDWVRSLRNQCAAAGVAFFFKQWGAWAWAPEDLNYDDARAWGTACFGPRTRHEFHSSGHTAFLVGKARAGAVLDGKEHRQWPA